ncbi:MAG: AI-2E family transporter [Oscillospiraceae bacterium]|nr:AI-2E family transporter [Oscillospiraceae bacterium]
MRRFDKLKEQRWFAYTLAGCVTVAVYLVLSHISVLSRVVSTVASYLGPLIGGCVIAYIMNSLAKIYQRLLFRKVKKEKTGWRLSILLTIITVLAFLVLMTAIVVPQLASSIVKLARNLNTYVATLQGWLENWGLGHNALGRLLNIQQLADSSEALLEAIVEYLSENTGKIISASTVAGKSIFNFVIAFIMSVYLLLEKANIKAGTHRLMNAVFVRQRRHDFILAVIRKCNVILNRYVVFNLIDSIIVGAANAIFMAICGMEYVGLISFLVAAANLVPTFGPLVGGVCGAFILVLTRPLHALLFIGFTIILQFLDGYVLKPRLYGSSLGISGLLVLTAIIVGGRIAGLVGILLAVPAAAILDYLYADCFLPWLEASRRRKIDREQGAEESSEPEKNRESAAPAMEAPDGPEPPETAEK